MVFMERKHSMRENLGCLTAQSFCDLLEKAGFESLLLPHCYLFPRYLGYLYSDLFIYKAANFFLEIKEVCL
jgi:hypothetical protein